MLLTEFVLEITKLLLGMKFNSTPELGVYREGKSGYIINDTSKSRGILLKYT